MNEIKLNTGPYGQVEFKINNLEIYPSLNGMRNVIKVVHYSARLTENDLEANAIGSIELKEPEINSFTAYENLKEETVIEWIKPHINMSDLESALKAKLKMIKDPIVAEKLPWIN